MYLVSDQRTKWCGDELSSTMYGIFFLFYKRDMLARGLWSLIGFEYVYVNINRFPVPMSPRFLLAIRADLGAFRTSKAVLQRGDQHSNQ
jgi:hypothetical protein